MKWAGGVLVWLAVFVIGGGALVAVCSSGAWRF